MCVLIGEVPLECRWFWVFPEGESVSSCDDDRHRNRTEETRSVKKWDGNRKLKSNCQSDCLPLDLEDGGNLEGRMTFFFFFFYNPHNKNKQSVKQQQCWRQCGQTYANHSHIFWSCIKKKKSHSFLGHCGSDSRRDFTLHLKKDPGIVYLKT